MEEILSVEEITARGEVKSVRLTSLVLSDGVTPMAVIEFMSGDPVATSHEIGAPLFQAQKDLAPPQETTA